jgi:hypothetical protein
MTVGTIVGVLVGIKTVVGVAGEQLRTIKIREHPAMRIFLMSVSPLWFSTLIAYLFFVSTPLENDFVGEGYDLSLSCQHIGKSIVGY